MDPLPLRSVVPFTSLMHLMGPMLWASASRCTPQADEEADALREAVAFDGADALHMAVAAGPKDTDALHEASAHHEAVALMRPMHFTRPMPAMGSVP